MKIELDGESLECTNFWRATQTALSTSENLEISISKSAMAQVQKGADFLHGLAHSGRTVYGINTGFGFFARTKISPDDIEKLQENIIMSHACGVGAPLPRDIVLGMWLVMINSQCRGKRGLAPQKLEHCLQAIAGGMLSVVPSRGSVGASGDLAPAAHAVLALMGQGRCTIPDGNSIIETDAAAALKKLKLAPLVLGAKEGLCLINGTQLTTAIAAKLWYEGSVLLKLANLAAAMTLEAMRASHAFLDPILMKEQRHPGASAVAKEIRSLLGSETEIHHSHENCDRVQDPYSIRCTPQVHGMAWEELASCKAILDLELNATTDNPILFPDEEKVIHGGNFHAIYAGRVCDRIAMALTTIANISERRINMAMKQEKSGLPNFLVKEGGLNSGFMMAQTTAAALVADCKALSFPATVDSIPTNNDQEDHVSMGPIAGVKALQILENLRHVLTIELLAAAQGLDLLSPLHSSKKLEEAKAKIRKIVPELKTDFYLGDAISKMSRKLEELV